VIWNSLRPSDRYAYLSALGSLTRYVQNDVLGYVGDKAALPFRTDVEPDVAAWFKGNILGNGGLREASDPVPVTLPTPGVTLETRLGQCDATEDYVTRHRALDLQQKAAEVRASEERAKQSEQETERYKQRLDQKLLDDPDGEPQAVRVLVEKEPES
jgi:hypothetical protein